MTKRKTWWRVCVECRKPGAIGEFIRINFPVRAEDETTARDWAVNDAHAYLWETRGIYACIGYNNQYDRDLTMLDDLRPQDRE